MDSAPVELDYNDPDISTITTVCNLFVYHSITTMISGTTEYRNNLPLHTIRPLGTRLRPLARYHRPNGFWSTTPRGI